MSLMERAFLGEVTEILGRLDERARQIGLTRYMAPHITIVPLIPAYMRRPKFQISLMREPGFSWIQGEGSCLQEAYAAVTLELDKHDTAGYARDFAATA